MIKITVKGLSGTISEHYFKTWGSAYAWLDDVSCENGVIGYIIEEVEE